VDVEAEVVGWHRRFSFLSTLDTTTVWVERPFHAILLDARSRVSSALAEKQDQ
jgi:hypothetical protein